MKGTINGNEVKQVNMKKAISIVTKTDSLGNTALATLPNFGITVDLENMTAECPSLDAMRAFAEPDAIVTVVDDGNTPRPRQFTWEVFVKRVETLVESAPLLVKAKELSESVKGLIEFENDSDGQESAPASALVSWE